VGITIRPVRSGEDYAAWRQVLLTVEPGERAPTAGELRAQAGPQQRFFVAELDGRLAGYIRVKPATTLRENAHVLGIVGLDVGPGDRRQGVGSALLAAAEPHARARGARKLSLRVLGTNETALRLYERHGFRREGTLRDEFLIEGRFVDDVLMTKHLA